MAEKWRRKKSSETEEGSTSASPKFLFGSVWGGLSNLRGRNESLIAVVSYVTAGGPRLLALRDGDTLIVDASLRAVRSGATDPRVLIALQKMGVALYTRDNLHAKVLVFDDVLVVGSANASANSESVLHEACVLVHDSASIAEARSWAKSLQIDELSPKQLKMLKSEYRPAKGGVTTPGRSNDAATLWIASMQHREHHAAFEAQVEATTETLQEQTKKNFVVESLEMHERNAFGKRAKVNDQVFMVYNDDQSVEVYPPARVVAVKLRKAGSVRRKYVWVEYDENAGTVETRRFIREATKLGLQRLSAKSTRMIRDSDIALALRKMFYEISTSV